MSAVLRIVDKQLGQAAHESFELHLASERLTVRELIERRVADEVEQLNQNRSKTRREHDRARAFLVRIDRDTTEKRLNASKPPRHQTTLNESAEIETAIKGFTSNAFVLLFDDHQVADLDCELTVTPTSEVVFLRMVPLVGG